MRAALIAALCIVLAAVFAGQSHAVGLYVVGKEDCDCSPLVAKGIVPDTLNKLKEAFLIPHLAYALDKLAQEIQAMLVSAGAPAATAYAEVKDDMASANIVSDASPEPPKPEKAIVEKPAKEKKSPVKHSKNVKKKKKKVKIPPSGKM